jgi:hypothetical protein
METDMTFWRIVAATLGVAFAVSIAGTLQPWC